MRRPISRLNCSGMVENGKTTLHVHVSPEQSFTAIPEACDRTDTKVKTIQKLLQNAIAQDSNVVTLMMKHYRSAISPFKHFRWLLSALKFNNSNSLNEKIMCCLQCWRILRKTFRP